MEIINFEGWSNCVRLTNQQIEIVVTTDVGPRIIRCGVPGGPNLFKVFPDQAGLTGGSQWRNYGGHRLWHAPEAQPRTYMPDNDPVKVEQGAGFVRFIQPVEAGTGIQKEIDIYLSETEAKATVVHRLRNTTVWDVRLSVWALSVMDSGGTAIVPLPPRGHHAGNLNPSSQLALWSYTDLSDARLTLGKKWILVRQDPTCVMPQKIGISVPDGWVAYVLGSQMLVTQVIYQPGAEYPDLGSSVEIFTNGDFLEVETLSPVVIVSPGQAAEHTETWTLIEGVTVPAGEADLDAAILPLLHSRQIIQ